MSTHVSTHHNKNQKLLKHLLKSFGQLSKTSQAAIFVLVFATIGGGYLLFTSSAAPLTPAATYTDWVWPITLGGYHNMSWSITPVVDPSPTGYLWSQNVNFTGGASGYLGLQTATTGTGAVTGKSVVLSVNSATGASSSGFSGPLTGDTAGFQAVIAYPWVTGRTYKLSLTQTNTATWSATVLDTTSNVATTVGQIQVPISWGGLTSNTTMWSEQFSPAIKNCSQVARSDVKFSTPTAEDGTVKPLLHYNNVLNILGCANGSILEIVDGIEQKVGSDIQAIVQELPVTLPTVPVVTPLPTNTPPPKTTPPPTNTPPSTTPGTPTGTTTGTTTKPKATSAPTTPTPVTIPKATPPILTEALAKAAGKESWVRRLLKDALATLLGALAVAGGIGIGFAVKGYILRRNSALLASGAKTATVGTTAGAAHATVTPTIVTPTISKDS